MIDVGERVVVVDGWGVGGCLLVAPLVNHHKRDIGNALCGSGKGLRL